MNISQWSVTSVFLTAIWAVRADIWTSEKLIARKSSEINLSCGSSDPYISCSWINPFNESCSNIKPGMSSKCPEVQGVILDASVNYCNIKVTSIKDSDNGNWTCKLEYPEIVEAASTELIVLEEAFVTFTKYRNTIIGIAGDTEFLTCQARHGRPVGKFIWKQVNPNGTEEIPETSEIAVSPEKKPGSGVFDAEETLQIELKPSDNEGKINCTYQQYGSQDDVIASNSIYIDLKVDFLEVKNVKKNLQGGPPFNITAQIYGSPKPKVTWQISGGNDRQVNLTEENPEDEQHHLDRLADSSDFYVYLSTLVIYSLPVKDAERTYKVFVESPKKDLYAAGEEVKLSAEEEVTPAAAESSSVTSIVITVFCILILVVVIVSTLVYAKMKHKWCFHFSSRHSPAKQKRQVEPIIKCRD